MKSRVIAGDSEETVYTAHPAWIFKVFVIQLTKAISDQMRAF